MVQPLLTNSLFLSSSMWSLRMVQNDNILRCLRNVSTKFDALAEDMEQLKHSQSETAASNHRQLRSETPLLAITNGCPRPH